MATSISRYTSDRQADKSCISGYTIARTKPRNPAPILALPRFASSWRGEHPVVSDRSRNRYGLTSGKLEVSSIFDWYRKHFSRGWKGIHSVEQFLAAYADKLADAPEQRTEIREQKAALEFLDYDWRLNDVGAR